MLSMAITAKETMTKTQLKQAKTSYVLLERTAGFFACFSNYLKEYLALITLCVLSVYSAFRIFWERGVKDEKFVFSLCDW
jgi:hypothetical protein